MFLLGVGLVLGGLGVLPPPVLPASPSFGDPFPTEIQGRLVHQGEPPGSSRVVLHRLRGDEAGAVDSVFVDTDGGFRFTLPETEPSDHPGATSVPLWLVTTLRDGITYASDPFTEQGAGQGGEIRLETFPSRPVPPGGIMLPLEGREISLGRPEEEGRWQVVDRFRIRNDSLATWVAGEDGPVVWQFPLPSGAVAVRYVDGDPLPDGVFFQGAGVQVTAPLRPGATVLTLTYELPSLEFRIPLPGVTEALGVRAAPGLPLLTVEGLEGPVRPGVDPDDDVGGFTVWTGTELQNRFLHVAPSPVGGAPPLVAILLGAVLVGVAVLVTLRRRDDEESVQD